MDFDQMLERCTAWFWSWFRTSEYRGTCIALKSGERATVLDARALHLVVRIKGENPETRLVRASDMSDDRQFWRIWAAISRCSTRWSDGSPANPRDF